MSGSRGTSTARNRSGDRFYNPPALRRQQQLPPHKPTTQTEPEKRTGDDDCSAPSVSSTVHDSSTNLDRFLEYTTPSVPAHYFRKTSMRGWRNYEVRKDSYFLLDDLWQSFKEWSVYGVGVPLLLNGSDSIVQYYVPYLSGIQLYIDPSKPLPSLRTFGEESDADSFKDSSSDGSVEWEAGGKINGDRQSRKLLSMKERLLTIDEGKIRNPPGLLMFEYFEQNPPYSREPLADKISLLSTKFPELRTYRSCDLSPASWISVAWYPIYRIPTGPTLQNLDACFLTFHSLSTSTISNQHLPSSNLRNVKSSREIPLKLSLPIFGLASYKFKDSVWNATGGHESQKVTSLLRAADNWLRLLHVNHPDYRFFISRNSQWR